MKMSGTAAAHKFTLTLINN